MSKPHLNVGMIGGGMLAGSTTLSAAITAALSEKGYPADTSMVIVEAPGHDQKSCFALNMAQEMMTKKPNVILAVLPSLELDDAVIAHEIRKALPVYYQEGQIRLLEDAAADAMIAKEATESAIELKKSGWERANPNQPWYSRFRKDHNKKRK